MLKKTNTENFETDITTMGTGSGHVVVDFSAEWCPPCQKMKPILEEVAAEGWRILVVDVDESPELAERFNVMGMPTFVIFQADKEVKRFSGARSKESFVEEISRTLS